MKVLLDTDALFGLTVATDANHEPAKKILTRLVDADCDLLMLNVTFYETITVLSNKAGQKAALFFIDNFSNLSIQIVPLDPEIENTALDLFKKQIKNRTSFVDCANLASVRKYKLDGIVTFDEFYPKSLRVV